MSGTFFTILLAVYTVFGLLFYELRYFVWIDEILAFAIAGYACVEMWLHRVPKYKPLIIWLCIDAFYLAYSILIHSNAYIAIFNDFVMQSKPYMTFFGLMCLKPRLEQKHMSLIAMLCIFCTLAMCAIYYIYPHYREGTFQGELLTGAAFSSVAILIAALFYMSCEHDNMATRFTTIIIMAIGLLAPTSKYMGTLLCSIVIIMFVSKPLKVNIRYIILCCVLAILTVWVAWDDFIFYFVEDAEYNARPVLYMNAPQILNDYFPFGSGFATYANAASGTWYSPLYAKYDMDNIWGLAEGETLFISDTYYPTLAQFGYAGVALFVVFLWYIFKSMNKTYDKLHDIKRYKVSLIIISYILIEATSSSFINERCITAMMILVMSLYKYQPKRQTHIDMFGLKFLEIKERHTPTKQQNDEYIDN